MARCRTSRRQMSNPVYYARVRAPRTLACEVGSHSSARENFYFGPIVCELVRARQRAKKNFDLNVGQTLSKSTTMTTSPKTIIKSEQPKLIKSPILFCNVFMISFSLFQQKCKHAWTHPPTSPVRKIHLHFRRSVKQFISYL